MTVRAAVVVARTITYLQLSFSHSSPIGSSQHLSSFLTFLTRRRPTPSLSSIIFKPTHFMLSLFSPISFPIFRVPIPFSTVSYHAVLVRGVISPSPSTLPIPYQSSAVLNYSTDSNSTSLDWTPPIRVPCLLRAITIYTGEADYSKNHWFIMMDTFGFEFETEEALFNYYIKALAAVVGSDEEAKKKIYIISCGINYGFGAEIDEETVDVLCDEPGIDAIQDFSHKCRKSNLGDCSAARFTPINWNRRVDDIFSYHHLSEFNSAWNSDHWLIHIQSVHGKFSTKQQVVDLCIRMLAEVVGSEDDAKNKIYSVWCKMPIGFGAEIDVETLNRLKALPDVLLVLPDYAFDVKLERAVLVIFPSTHLKSNSPNYYYQPYQVRSHEDSEESMEEALGESVQSVAPFTLMNYNHRLDNIFSYHHLSEKNSKWNSDHWLIVIKQRECELKTEARTLDLFIKILAEAIGSEQEAKERIYIIWSNFPFGFGAEIDGETSNKLKGCPNVLKVLPDYAFDVKDKVTGGLLISSSLQKSRFYYYTKISLKYLKEVHGCNPHPDYS